MAKKKKYISGGKWQCQRLRLIKFHWYGGVCMVKGCTEDQNLELAHVIPTPLSKKKPFGWRSSYERLNDVMKYPERFLLLCTQHHRKYDNRNAENDWNRNRP